MNNLTTRKIVFGMLMVLVLAFSVQGIADAETVTRRSSDDLEVRDIGDTTVFEVNFEVDDVDTDDTLSIPYASSPTGLTLKKIGSHTIPDEVTSNVTLDADFDSTDDEPYEELEEKNYSVEYTVSSSTSAGKKTVTIGGVAFIVYVVKDAATANAGRYRSSFGCFS